MAISIMGGVSGITVETDPTALKLTGGTLSGTLFLPTARNLLNADLNIVSYNDTGAGTTYTHAFKPFDGTFQLAPNGGGLRFPNGTVQTTAGLPLTGGTATGKVNFTAVSGVAGINIGVGGDQTNSTTAGDMWITTGGTLLNYRDATGSWRQVLTTTQVGTIDVSSATSPALRITQRGAGHALLVEDSANPDTTATFISNAGLVYVNYDPAGSLPTGAVLNINGSVNFDGQIPPTHSNAFTVYNKEFMINIGGFSYAIPCRAI